MDLKTHLALLAIQEEPDLEIPRYAFDGTELKTAEQVALAMGIPVIEAELRIKAIVRDIAFWGPRGYKLGETIGRHAERRKLKRGRKTQVPVEEHPTGTSVRAHPVFIGGKKYIRKQSQYTHGQARRWSKPVADSEYFGSLVGRALGAPVPDVIRSPRRRDQPHTVYVENIDMVDQGDYDGDKQALYESPAGVRIGLLDMLFGQVDRKDNNWGVVQDEAGNDQPIAFDFEQALLTDLAQGTYPVDTWPDGSHFASANFMDEDGVLADNPLTPEQVDHYRTALQGLQQEFEKAGRLDWYYVLLSRFELIAAHATGVDEDGIEVKGGRRFVRKLTPYWLVRGYTRVGQEIGSVQQRHAAMRQSLSARPEEIDTFGGGVDKVESADGRVFTRRTPRRISGLPPKAQADAEYFTALVGDAIGAPVADVIRSPHDDPDKHIVYTEFLDGPEPDFRGRDYFKWAKQYLDTDDGILIGLLDTLVGQRDRVATNWKLIEDEDGNLTPVAFDNTDIEIANDRPNYNYLAGSEFASRHFVDRSGEDLIDNPLTPSQIADFRQALVSMRQEFVDGGRLDWYEEIMRRFEMIAERARGEDAEFKGSRRFVRKLTPYWLVRGYTRVGQEIGSVDREESTPRPRVKPTHGSRANPLRGEAAFASVPTRFVKEPEDYDSDEDLRAVSISDIPGVSENRLSAYSAALSRQASIDQSRMADYLRHGQLSGRSGRQKHTMKLSLRRKNGESQERYDARKRRIRYEHHATMYLSEAQIQIDIAALDDMFDRVEPLKKPITVYRGLSDIDPSDLGFDDDDWSTTVGKEFVDHSYVSTTTDRSVAVDQFMDRRRGSLLIEMVLPEGASVVAIHNEEHDEQEVLNPRGYTYRIVGYEQDLLSEEPRRHMEILRVEAIPKLPRDVPGVDEIDVDAAGYRERRYREAAERVVEHEYEPDREAERRRRAAKKNAAAIKPPPKKIIYPGGGASVTFGE